ncbi:hypothetical protein L083_5425 [Actinoplanes sp. N902-109]|nr:hypothetical protein L083_5425 [Actinoplanes sp. N902-109]
MRPQRRGRGGYSHSTVEASTTLVRTAALSSGAVRSIVASLVSSLVQACGAGKRKYSCAFRRSNCSGKGGPRRRRRNPPALSNGSD